MSDKKPDYLGFDRPTHTYTHRKIFARDEGDAGTGICSSCDAGGRGVVLGGKFLCRICLPPEVKP